MTDLKADPSVPSYSLGALVRYFLGLGTWGFGGPVALVGYMHRDLVEQKKWITEEDYKEGLALAQLMPGPLAAQLSIYLGYVHYRIVGATLIGLAFVLPSFMMVLGIGWAYMRYGGLPWMADLFYGVGAAVIGLITIGGYKLSRKSLGADALLWGIAFVLAVVTFIAEQEVIWLVLGGGVLVLLWRHYRRPGAAVSIAPLLLMTSTVEQGGILGQIAWFFTKAGAFVFGSGLAIVPFLYGGVVKEYGWLNEQQFLDAVAVAMITPGPVVITVGFIGYLVAGFPGACVAALATFLPCYLFTVLPAPYFKKYGRLPALRAFIDGVTAAAVGAILGAVLVLAKRQLSDIPAIAIALVTAALLVRFKKLPEPVVIAVAGIVGLVLRSHW
jgi:chromate transporter